MSSRRTRRAPVAPNVSFARPLIRGNRGSDVTAHKRAISRWNPKVYPWGPFTDVFGAYLEQAVKEFQRAHGIQATGRIGRTTHEALERTRRHGSKQWAFDQRAIDLARAYHQAHSQTPEEMFRDRIVSAAGYWYEHRGGISYSQYRPFQRGKPPWVPSRWDCSGFVTCCYEAGGAPDPNGRGYDGLGYTGTLVDNGSPVSRDQLKLGDLVFYGSSWGRPGFPAGSPTHVALYAGRHNGIQMVRSLGSYPMGFYRIDYRSINHCRTYRVVP